MDWPACSGGGAPNDKSAAGEEAADLEVVFLIQASLATRWPRQ